MFYIIQYTKLSYFLFCQLRFICQHCRFSITHDGTVMILTKGSIFHGFSYKLQTEYILGTGDAMFNACTSGGYLLNLVLRDNIFS